MGDVEHARGGHRAEVVSAFYLCGGQSGQGGVSAADAAQFQRYLGSAAELRQPLPLAGVAAADYDAVFIPGGHGPMVDLARDVDLGRLLGDVNSSGKIIAVLCRGSAALLTSWRANCAPAAPS